nr:hypothetical protein [uncultured Oscillibacter sp.]
MERRSPTCFLILTLPAAVLRLGAGWVELSRIWRMLKWMTSWY